MKLPLPYDYQMALQAPSVAFADETLRRGVPRRNPLGLPATISGGFALTFDITVDRTRYAVRCFHKEGNHLQQRYAAVADFIRTARLDFLVDVAYLHAGVRVGTQTFPIVRMPWVDGARLDDWVDDHLDQPAALDRVRRNIAAAVATLREHGAAHGDLQHGNILVRSDESIRLVDYDGMYLPALHQYGAAERGHRNYQHPDRADQYDATLDLFAAAVIDLSLAALTCAPRLWKDLNRNSGESLLFEAEDFADPASSTVFTRLAQIPSLTEQVNRVRHACGVRFDVVAAALTGTATTTATPRRSGAPHAAPATVLRATDRASLLAHQGDDVTVVGRIVDTKTIDRTSTITFLNFGNYRRGDFTVVAWERGHRGLLSTFGDPHRLAGSWVSVTGVLSAYRHPRTATTTPQIELHNARSLRVLTAAQAATLLAPAARTAPPPPAPPTTPRTAAPPPRPATGRPAATPTTQGAASAPAASGGTGGDLTDRLGRLYSTPTFTARVGNAGAPSTPRPPAPGPAGPPPAAPPPPPRKPPGGSAPSGAGSASSGSGSAPSGAGSASYGSASYGSTSYGSASYGSAPFGSAPYGSASYGPNSYGPASYGPAPVVSSSWFGVAALIAAVVLGPVGGVFAGVVLAMRLCRTDTDRACAWIGLVIGSFWTLCCCGSMLLSLIQGSGT